MSPAPLLARPGRPRRRRAAGLVAALTTAAMLLAACGGGDDGGDATAATTGAPGVATTMADAPQATELTIATPSLPTSFAHDAGGGSGLEYQEFLKLTSATLLRKPYVPNANGDLVADTPNQEGYLAESYELSADGRTFTFHLRQGVMSPAGNEFDADDVLFSAERKFKTATSTSSSSSFPIITDLAQFEKVDQHTFTFTLNQPSDAFTFLTLMTTLTWYLYDKDLLLSHATPEDPYGVVWSKTNSNYSWGPYVLDEFVPDQQMVLTANPNAPLGEPAIKKLTFKVVTDPGSRANALRSGDVDIASALRPADQADLAEDAAFDVYEFPSTNSMLMMPLVTTHAPFDDKLVRQALAYAIPYDQIIESVYAGTRASTNTGILNPDIPGYVGDDLPEYGFDPDRAKELLTEAGHTDPVKFKLTVSNAVPDVQEAAVLIQSYAQDAGFEVEIEELPPAAYAAGTRTLEWDAYMFRDYAITLSPPYELNLFLKREPFPTTTGWRPPAYYEILDRGVAAGDPFSPAAQEIWNEAQQMLLDEAPMLFMLRLQPFNAFRAGVSGFAWRSDNLIDYEPITATEA